MEKKLYRSRTDQKLCGVCSGLARYFEIDATVVRILWVLAAIFAGAGLLAYFICALIMPVEPENY